MYMNEYSRYSQSCGRRGFSCMACPKMNDDKPLCEYSIAMGYVPWQKFRNLYEPEKGLCRGTIFQELDLEFLGKRGCKS